MGEAGSVALVCLFPLLLTTQPQNSLKYQLHMYGYVCIMHVYNKKDFWFFSYIITLMVFGGFLSISATEALMLQKLCSALLATEIQCATVTLSAPQIQISWGKLNTFAKNLKNQNQTWKPAPFALRAMIFHGVRLANPLTTTILTFSTKPCAFFLLCATVGMCWGWSDFHEVKPLMAGSNETARKNTTLEKQQKYRGLPYVLLRKQPSRNLHSPREYNDSLTIN